MTALRECGQCGKLFDPPREHARFCSATCRVAWNAEQDHDSPATAEALAWSLAAMTQATDRLVSMANCDHPTGFAVISECVWWVTMVDATMIRYHGDAYDAILDAEPDCGRQVIEDTLGGLRFVRNNLGFRRDPADFIHLDAGSGGGGTDAWTWKPVSPLESRPLTPGEQDWELARYSSYQARLAGRPVAPSFTHAASFLARVAQKT